MRLLLAIGLLLASMIPIAHSGVASISIYYNGTVVAHFQGITSFTIIGNNVSELRVQGSKFNLTGDVLQFYNPNSSITVTYQTSFRQGVVKGSEPFNATFNFLFPPTFTLVYVSPSPQSLKVSGNLYNLTLVGDSFNIVYAPVSKPSSPIGEEDLLILIALVVSDSVLAGLVIYLYRRGRVKRVEQPQSEPQVSNVSQEAEEEETELTQETLNDRDILVLEAFKQGAKTLSDAVKATGLPKSTVYRRIKKLVRLGYLVERREKGKIWYEVGTPHGEKSEDHTNV